MIHGSTIRILAGIAALAAIAIGCSGEGEKTGETPHTPAFGTVTVTITDGATGRPVHARVYAYGSDDSLYMADACIPYDRPRFASRIGYSGRHFTTLGEPFSIDMPEGVARFVVERGKEYHRAEKRVMVTAGQTVETDIVLDRWIDMNERGWYSGDLHVHRPLGDLADLMLAEDLNVAAPQTVWGRKREPDLDAWLERAGDDGTITVGENRAFSVLGHEIERFSNSALLFHHTGKTLLPIAEFDEEGRSNLDLIRLARDAGGYVEAEKPWWPESHIDIAVGGADFVGIANNHFTYRSYLPEHPRRRTEFADDYPEGAEGYAAYVFDLYYAYLNCGFRVMPTAGSASGVLPNPLGYNRVYVRMGGPFSIGAWFEALKKGRCFVTNGPMLFITVNNARMGETVRVDGGRATVSCGIYTARPLDRLEIILDGEVVETVRPGGTSVTDVIVDVAESGWIAARCFEKSGDTVRFAHTAPVFLEVPGKPFKPKADAARYFLRKSRELVTRAETAEYPSDAARDAAMGAYQSAVATFERILENSR